MVHSEQEKKFIFITAVLVVVTGFAAIKSLQGVTQETNEVSYSSREPASIQPSTAIAPTLVIPKIQESLAVDLNCKSGRSLPPQFEVDADTLKIVGRNCFGSDIERNFEVINESNGFTGSVFLLPEGKFQTDFVQLVKGNNRVRVKIGSIWQEITVISRR